MQIPEEKRDPTLPDKFDVEMPGILNWALEGARDWLANGLQIPERCRVATQEFRKASDSLGDFLDEVVVEDAAGRILKSELFRRYQAFADDSGIRNPMSKRGLGIALSQRGWAEGYDNRSGQRTWTGWRLKADFE